MTAALKLAREYELVYILRPAVAPSEAKRVSDRVSDVIGRAGARLTRVDNWGKRKLAYTIKTAGGRHTRGVFVYVRFVALNDVVSELERNLRNLDEVIRFQTVRLEALYDMDALEVDPEEVAFREIEVTEDEEEPSFEESLGMRTRERPRAEAPADEETPDEETETETEPEAETDTEEED